MVLWWIGNIIFLVVVIPVVLILLNRVLQPTKEIDEYAKDVLEHGVALTAALDEVAKLRRTQELASSARQSATRYVAALEQLM